MSHAPKSLPKLGLPPWILFLGASMVLMFLVNIYFVVISSQSPHAMTEKNYYQQSLEWDQKRERETRLDSLGFNFKFIISSNNLLLISHSDSIPSHKLSARFSGLKLKLILKRPNDPNSDLELLMNQVEIINGQNKINWEKENVHLKAGKWLCRIVFENPSGPILERSFTQWVEG